MGMNEIILREDMVVALLSTEELFARLAQQTAQLYGYEYPKEAEAYAESLIDTSFGE